MTLVCCFTYCLSVFAVRRVASISNLRTACVYDLTCSRKLKQQYTETKHNLYLAGFQCTVDEEQHESAFACDELRCETTVDWLTFSHQHETRIIYSVTSTGRELLQRRILAQHVPPVASCRSGSQVPPSQSPYSVVGNLLGPSLIFLQTLHRPRKRIPVSWLGEHDYVLVGRVGIGIERPVKVLSPLERMRDGDGTTK